MSGFAQVGQVLKLLDMIPDKKAKKTFIEKLPSAQKLDGGNMGDVMKKLMSGGLSSLMQNPVAAILKAVTSLMGSIGGAQSAAGNPQTAAAAGQLGATLAVAETVVASMMSDVAVVEGQATALDIILHESVADALGDAAPPEIALELATAPAMAGPLYRRVAAVAYDLNGQLLRGLVSDKDVAERFQAMNTEVATMLNASALALRRADEIAQSVTSVHAMAGLLVSGSDGLKAFLRIILRPEIAAAMDAALVDRLTIAPNDDEVMPPELVELTTCV